MTVEEIILRDFGPLMSGQLAGKLASKENIPINTASQKISRNKAILKIKGFFQSRQSFCYLEEHNSSVNLFEVLSDAMYIHGAKYWYCLNALKMNNGILRKEELECYTNYPIDKLVGHKPFTEVINNFISQKIINYDDKHYFLSPKFTNTHYNILKGRILSETRRIILDDFSNILKNTGLVSYNSVSHFDEFGKFRWNFKGPSYVIGLRGENNKPGYVLADILLGNSFAKKDIDFFCKKIDHIMSFKGASRIIPYLIVDSLDEEALSELKKRGIVIGFISDLLGIKYADAIRDLVNLLNNIGACLGKDADKFLENLSKIEKNAPTLIRSLRGSLFEFIVGYIIQQEYKNIDVGRIIYDTENNSKHECDIFAYNDKEVIMVECKATKDPITDTDIRKWAREVIPHMQKWIEKQDLLSAKTLRFEYWSIGGYTDTSLMRLTKLKDNAKRFKIDFHDKPSIIAIIKKLKNKHLTDIFNHYYNCNVQ